MMTHRSFYFKREEGFVQNMFVELLTLCKSGLYC